VTSRSYGLAVGFALPEEHTGLGFAITPGIVAEVVTKAIGQSLAGG